jgi:predicted phage-related endonuclease
MIDLELRSQGIGGSEVAAVLGYDSDEREIWSIYNRKIGLPEPEVDPEMRMRRAIGKDLEQSIVRSYTRMTGHRAEWFDKTVQHPDRPWQIGSPDAISPSAAAPESGIDAKNVAFDQRFLWGHPNERDAHFPERYEWQARWYMSLLDVDDWHIIALLGGSDLRIFTVERDMQKERQMLAEVEEFWIRHVVPRVPPEINYSRSARDYVHAMHPRERGIVRVATDLECALLAQYQLARETLTATEQEKKRLETEIKAAIGDDEGIKSDDYRFTWKMTKDSERTDWKALALHLWTEFAPIEAKPFSEHQAQYIETKPGERRVWFSGDR